MRAPFEAICCCLLLGGTLLVKIGALVDGETYQEVTECVRACYQFLSTGFTQASIDIGDLYRLICDHVDNALSLNMSIGLGHISWADVCEGGSLYVRVVGHYLRRLIFVAVLWYLVRGHLASLWIWLSITFCNIFGTLVERARPVLGALGKVLQHISVSGPVSESIAPLFHRIEASISALVEGEREAATHGTGPNSPVNANSPFGLHFPSPPGHTNMSANTVLLASTGSSTENNVDAEAGHLEGGDNVNGGSDDTLVDFPDDNGSDGAVSDGDPPGRNLDNYLVTSSKYVSQDAVDPCQGPLSYRTFTRSSISSSVKSPISLCSEGGSPVVEHCLADQLAMARNDGEDSEGSDTY